MQKKPKQDNVQKERAPKKQEDSQTIATGMEVPTINTNPKSKENPKPRTITQTTNSVMPEQTKVDSVNVVQEEEKK